MMRYIRIVVASAAQDFMNLMWEMLVSEMVEVAQANELKALNVGKI